MTQPRIRTLIFSNTFHEDESPTVHVLKVTDDTDIHPILEWYGSFYSGDPYTVTLDGRRFILDHNGEETGPTLTAIPGGQE